MLLVGRLLEGGVALTLLQISERQLSAVRSRNYLHEPGVVVDVVEKKQRTDDEHADLVVRQFIFGGFSTATRKGVKPVSGSHDAAENPSGDVEVFAFVRDVGDIVVDVLLSPR